MNWRYETWRKLYVREEGSFAALSYSARAAAAMLLKLCDERGRIYARRGEELVEGICCRLGADRGERRKLKQAIADLVADGYLAQGDGWLRIKNFHHAQGKVEELEESAAPAAAPALSEAIETPSSTEAVSMVSRPCLEADATVSRPCIEECVKSAETAAVRSDVPSVPFLPEVPSTREPDPPLPVPLHGSVLVGVGATGAGVVTPQALLDLFGRIRSEVCENTLPWQVASPSLWAKASRMAATFESNRDAVAAIEPSMRLLLERKRESQDPRDADPAFLFGCWVSQFTVLREVVEGLRRGPVSGEQPCSFHAGGRNSGKRAMKHEWRPSCSECRHLEARAGPRAAARPESIADVMSGR